MRQPTHSAAPQRGAAPPAGKTRDRAQRAEHEYESVGIVLCSKQNAAMVKIALPENDQIIAATDHRYLPSEAELERDASASRQSARSG
jgi:hypothetical protein